jgi:hypothetical protein
MFVLGLVLPMLDTVLLVSFVLWTVSRRGVASRAYVFEALQLCLTALWVTLTVLFELQPAPASEDLHGMVLDPILIVLQMVDCALHGIFLVHFGILLHFKDGDAGGRIAL